MPKKRHNIIPQMFDVRPVDAHGELDWMRIDAVIKNVKKSARGSSVRTQRSARKKNITPSHIYQLGKPFSTYEVPLFRTSSYHPPAASISHHSVAELAPEDDNSVAPQETRKKNLVAEEPLDNDREIILPQGSFRFADFILSLGNSAYALMPRKRAFSFALAIAVVVCLVGSVSVAKRGIDTRGVVLGVGTEAYQALLSAFDDVRAQNFDASLASFRYAHDRFSYASFRITSVGGVFTDLTRFVPLLSKLSSGKYLAEAGKEMADAGASLSRAAQEFTAVNNPLNTQEDQSLLTLFDRISHYVADAHKNLQQAQKYLALVKTDDVPQEHRTSLVAAKQQLPTLLAVAEGFVDNSALVRDLLGGNGPRKYLFLFQNNHEMRATGGFIGSYGLLDIADGHVRTFFVDGIFNPDGQLKEKIVPPEPIQKISAAWSLHDSNWFPHFPTSAHKAMVFYEKTGGPTVDGVIAVTPVVLEKILRLTGPVALSDYGVTLTAENFMTVTQYEVEADYDKEENAPKKILGDLASVLFDRVFATRDPEVLAQLIEIIQESVTEKHILLYARNQSLQHIIHTHGWDGALLPTRKDYVSVVNTNINGFKTDGVVEESIEHVAEVQSDGSIINTVTITRHHTGGATGYLWLDRVNANYQRIYVPQGSVLLSVEGQTRERVMPPLDYAALGFVRDENVAREEDYMVIDEASGTRIYDEDGKTVFANWVYVSPQETTRVTYRYQLPFRIEKDAKEGAYSVLFQKQSGSRGSSLTSRIVFPQSFSVAWQSDDQSLERYDGEFVYRKTLDVDRFFGIIFASRNSSASH